MKERPIIFSGPMVRAILDGRKTQTRRIVKDAPADAGCARAGETWSTGKMSVAFFAGGTPESPGIGDVVRSPYGTIGDRLWVRETWLPLDPDHYHESGPRDHLVTRYGPRRNGVGYRADMTPGDHDQERCRIELGYTRWHPSIHMPRWASRITLEITKVRVERLREISQGDAVAEGVERDPCDHVRYSCEDIGCLGPYVAPFRELWDEINGKRAPWESNPWVWVYAFRRIEEGVR